MASAWEVVIVLLSAVLLGIACFGLVIGAAALLDDEHLERCPSCHRFGLTAGGTRHPEGCPPSAVSHLAHPVRIRHGLHLHSGPPAS